MDSDSDDYEYVPPPFTDESDKDKPVNALTDAITAYVEKQITIALGKTAYYDHSAGEERALREAIQAIVELN